MERTKLVSFRLAYANLMRTSSTNLACFLYVLVDVAYVYNYYFANEITYYFVSAAIECVYHMTNHRLHIKVGKDDVDKIKMR